MDQSDQIRLVKKCLDAEKIDLKTIGQKPLAILNGIGKIKAEKFQRRGSSKERKSKKGLAESIAAKIYGAYRQTLYSNNAVDFDDLIFLARELLLQHSDVRGHVQRRWSHVLVDEFQDTSRSQMDLVTLITSESLFVVGDADQSIYSWRGAHVTSMSDFADEFRDHPLGVKTVHLKENYR